MFFECETFEFLNLYFYMLFCNLRQLGKVYVICNPFGLTKGNSNKILICLELWTVVFVLEPTWYELWVFGYVCFGTCLNERWEYLDHFQVFYQEHHYVNFHLVDICSIVTFVLNWNLWIILLSILVPLYVIQYPLFVLFKSWLCYLLNCGKLTPLP